MKKSVVMAGLVLVMVGALSSGLVSAQDAKATKTEDAAKAETKTEEAAQAAPKAEHAKRVHRAARRTKDGQPVDAEGRPLSTKSVAARTALCKADCSPAKYDQKTGIGIHGIYRAYQKFDPHLVSPEGKREYAECVKKCTDPLPTVYVQRAIFGMGMKWFGQDSKSCLDCHERGH